MRVVLLGVAAALAAIALPAAPAEAQGFASHGVNVHHGSQPSFDSGFRSGHGDFDRRDRRRHRDSDGAVFIYDLGRQSDSAWRSNSFNDWWHDQPHRSYPRWLQSNQNCERMWYAGATLRC